MGNGTQEIQVLLSTGPQGEPLDKPVVLYVEAREGFGEAEVGNKVVDGLQNVLDAIRVMSGQIAETVKDVSPDKFTVQLGFEMKAEAGGLVAMLVRTGGSASLQVTLEWDKAAAPPPAAPPPPAVTQAAVPQQAAAPQPAVAAS